MSNKGKEQACMENRDIGLRKFTSYCSLKPLTGRAWVEVVPAKLSFFADPTSPIPYPAVHHVMVAGD